MVIYEVEQENARDFPAKKGPQTALAEQRHISVKCTLNWEPFHNREMVKINGMVIISLLKPFSSKR